MSTVPVPQKALPEAALHPGRILYIEYLEPAFGWAGRDVDLPEIARQLAVDPKGFEAFTRGEIPLTTLLAAKLARKFRTTEQYWIELQAEYNIASRNSLKIS